jgi:hypothetical protein
MFSSMPPPTDDEPIKVKVLESKYADFEPAPAPAGGPGLGFALEQAEVAPPVTAENTICARGPCRHFWVMVSTAPAGNPSGTFAELGLPEPRQYNYACLAHPGTETELGEDQIFECSRWDPMTRGELIQIRRRRAEYARPSWFIRLFRFLLRRPQEIT